MLEKILGNKTAPKVMYHLFHYGEISASQIARDYKVALSPVQNQLERFEKAGVLVSKMMGRTRVYSFNYKSPQTKAFTNLIKIYYDTLSKEDRAIIFEERRRPRRKGKPVIGRGGS